MVAQSRHFVDTSLSLPKSCPAALVMPATVKPEPGRVLNSPMASTMVVAACNVGQEIRIVPIAKEGVCHVGHVQNGGVRGRWATMAVPPGATWSPAGKLKVQKPMRSYTGTIGNNTTVAAVAKGVFVQENRRRRGVVESMYLLLKNLRPLRTQQGALSAQQGNCRAEGARLL